MKKIPRRTAILVKEDNFSLNFAYPSDFGSIGWLLDSREETTYDESPVAAIRFAEYSFPDLTGKRAAKSTFYFKTMEYSPSLVRREIIFSNIGLEVNEQFGHNQAGGGFFWDLQLKCKSHPPYPFEKRLYSIVTLGKPAAVEAATKDRQTLRLKLGDKKLFIASHLDGFGVYETTEDYLRDIQRGRLSSSRHTGRHVVLAHRTRLNMGETARVVFGASFESAAKAKRARDVVNCERKIAETWDKWFASLPSLNFESEDDMRAYYKCWWVIRSNYYKHPRWGKTVLEALPVYRGYWQWALPAVEWHSTLNLLQYCQQDHFSNRSESNSCQ